MPVTLSYLLLILLLLTYQVIIMDRFYPITMVGDQNISFLTPDQAIQKINQAFQKRSKDQISFNPSTNSGQIFQIDLATSSTTLDSQPIRESFKSEHSGNFFAHINKQLQALLTKNAPPTVNFSLEKQIETISAAVKKEPQDAQLIYSEASEGASIQIKAGEDGLQLDKEGLQKQITDYLLSGKYIQYLPLKVVPPKVQTANAVRAKTALEALQKDSLKLKFEGSVWLLDTKTLLTLLDLTSQDTIPLDKEKTLGFIDNISKEINQDVAEGLFDIDPSTKRVSAFKASQDGRKLDTDKTYHLIVDALTNPGTSTTVNLPVDIVKPKIQTSDVNSLGIKELIGRGVSNFAGSIPNRSYNVNLTAQKINGVLIPPGEIFSFNKTVGDISAATGFKQAYVIKEGRTVLDDGGGVCQDSTTLFRAVLNAGLPVLQRTAHAYRVGYYEQGFPPGLDATVFYPSVDFQFKNDTPGYILVQAYTAGTTLYVDLYGTSDGRVAYLTNPVITGQTPPPPDLRQDDPTLPRGTIKQVDFSAWGANVSFKRTVTRAGETLADETWRSSYKSWQAIYLIGTQ